MHRPSLRIGFKAALRWLQWWWIAKSWITQPLVVPWFWISSAVFSSFSWVSMFFPMVCVVCGDPCGDELLKPGPLNLTHPSHLHQLVPSLFLPHCIFCRFCLEIFTICQCLVSCHWNNRSWDLGKDDQKPMPSMILLWSVLGMCRWISLNIELT